MGHVSNQWTEGLRQEGVLYVGPGRGVQGSCPVPLLRPSKQQSMHHHSPGQAKDVCVAVLEKLEAASEKALL